VVGPLTAELTKAEVPGRKVITAPTPNWRGIRVDYAMLQRVVDLADRLPGGEGEEADLYEPGVRIVSVEPGSPAEAAGLAENQLITHVAGVPVDTPREFFSALGGKDQEPIQLRLGERAEPALRTIEPGL
jgi:S1-C subfamily serine protease